MEIDRKKIPANKVYEKHCKGAIWTGFLGLIIACLMAAYLFLPIIAYFPSGEQRVDMSGFNFICYCFRGFFKGIYNSGFDRFSSSLKGYAGTNSVFLFVGRNGQSVEIFTMAFLTISVVFSLVVLIYSIAFLIKGHLKTTLMVSALSHSVASFSAIFTGVLFLYLLLCRKMFIEMNINDHIRFFITPFVIVLTITILSFVLSGIYKKWFRKRVYILNYKIKEEDDPVVANNPVFKYVKNFPNGTTQIGDHAFEGKEEIETALIPNGIILLGKNAFTNCPNLTSVTIPASVQEIGTECFMNTPKLKTIIYKGTLEQWKSLYFGTNWLMDSGAETVEASDGKLVLK